MAHPTIHGHTLSIAAKPIWPYRKPTDAGRQLHPTTCGWGITVGMNIYLDIDGVLLANEKNLTLGAQEFIKHVVTNYPTFWLTTHCMDGDPALAIENVGKLCDPEIV